MQRALWLLGATALVAGCATKPDATSTERVGTVGQALNSDQASHVGYDNSQSGLSATTVQGAIDEVAAKPGTPGPAGSAGPAGPPGPPGPPGPAAAHGTQLYVITSAQCAGSTTGSLVTTTPSCSYTACSGSANVDPSCDTGCAETGPAVVKQTCTPFGCTNVDRCAPCSCTNPSIGFAVQ